MLKLLLQWMERPHFLGCEIIQPIKFFSQKNKMADLLKMLGI
jgi:hypothetical protein